MSFIEELRWRGLIQDATPGLEDALSKGMKTAYIGFDPTAPSLTIGNYVQIMMLTFFQRAGHRPIVLMGGATGRIGDPSGKDAERQLLPIEVLERNVERQEALFRKFLNFEEGENRAMMRNNYDFYKDMNVLQFLRDVGKGMTVNYMMSKESVKNRLQTGISFTEFSYQVLQAYDFLCLYRQDNCILQIGGSDQWGNITSGTHIIGKNTEDASVYGLTCPLLVKADGKKFGKSESGNIWVDPEYTSPYKFYQFWLNAADADMGRFMRTFSLLDRPTIEGLEAQHAEAPHERLLQKTLAKELTTRIHSAEAYELALEASSFFFNSKMTPDTLRATSVAVLETVGREIPNFKIQKSALPPSINIIDLISGNIVPEIKIVNSKGEARKAIKNNALSVNKEKIRNAEASITKDDFVHDKYLMVENGKKNKFLIVGE